MPTVTPVSDITGQPAIQGQAPDRQPSISEKAPAGAPEATGAPQVDPQVAARQAEMARREQAIRREARRVAAERQRISAIEAENAQYKAREAKLSTDPVNALSEYGITGDQLTQSILNQPSAEEIRQRKIEADVKAVKDAMEAQQSASYEQAKRQIRREADFLVSQDKAYETTKAMNATEAIVELIEQTFFAPENEGGGYLMPVEEAAREVEEYLVGEAIKLAQLEKIKTRLSPAQSQHAAAPQQQTQKPQLNTLSNRQMPSTAKPSTDRERRERAILAFQGKLS